MRLIDADALWAALCRSEAIEDAYGSGVLEIFSDILDDMLGDAPTVDAVPVVRCRDCKYRKVYEYHYKGIGYRSTDCTIGNEGVIGTCEDSGYCSLAERKAEP